MIKINAVSDVTVPPGLRSCRVRRVDSCNTVCMVHNPKCVWVTAYGNYCEHPMAARIAEYESRGADDALRYFLH